MSSSIAYVLSLPGSEVSSIEVSTGGGSGVVELTLSEASLAPTELMAETR